MSIHKILGFILLGLGLLIIATSIVLSWQIFAGESSAPQLFSVPEKMAETSTVSVNSLEDLSKQLPSLLGGQLEELLPSETIPQMLNLAAWSMFAGILLLGGSLVAGIGIKLVK